MCVGTLVPVLCAKPLPFAALRTVTGQAPLSMGILQARTLEWVAVPSSGDLPDQGWHLHLQCRALAGGFFTVSSIWCY